MSNLFHYMMPWKAELPSRSNFSLVSSCRLEFLVGGAAVVQPHPAKLGGRQFRKVLVVGLAVVGGAVAGGTAAIATAHEHVVLATAVSAVTRHKNISRLQSTIFRKSPV